MKENESQVDEAIRKSRVLLMHKLQMPRVSDRYAGNFIRHATRARSPPFMLRVFRPLAGLYELLIA